MADKLVREFSKIIAESQKRKTQPYNTSATVLRIDDDVVWVRIPGSVDETPVQKTMSASEGDTVQVRISNGKAWILGNATNPPTDDTRANVAVNIATNANIEALRAADAAYAAQNSAAVAHEAAVEAKADAAIAAEAAEAAEANAAQSAEAAGRSETSAQQAEANASASATAAQKAQANAAQSATAAQNAQANAAQSAASASQAQQSAAEASEYARGALTSAATVQSVVDTVAWLAEHATVTDDTTVDPDKNYYKRNQDGTYVLVDNPTGNPHAQGLYEMDEAVSNYVAAHLALATHGLELVLDESSYRIHIGTHPVTGQSGTDGVYIIDQYGNVVSYFGENIRFSDNKRQYIGNNNAYVIFDPANGGSISIGGANITLGDNRTLDQVIATVDNTLIYDHTYTYGDLVDDKPTTATFTAFLYRGGVDVKYETDGDEPKYPPSQFTWYLKKEDTNGTKEVPIINSQTGTNEGYTCTVNLADCGYGAEVIGKYTSLDNAQALDTSGNNLTNVDNEPLSVRATGDTIRVRDLTTSSVIFPNEKLMVVGSEDEHLVTIQTLAQYILESETHILYCGTATELV